MLTSTGEIFYYLIARRQLISKLNVCNVQHVPKMRSLKAKFIFTLSREKRLGYADYYQTFLLFEKIFDKASSTKFFNYKGTPFKYLRKSGKATLVVDLRGLDLYNFLFKLSVFMTNDQKRFCSYDELNAYNCRGEKKEKQDVNKISFAGLIKEFTRNTARGVINVDDNLLPNSQLKTYWDNFDMFKNLSTPFRFGHSFTYDHNNFCLIFQGGKYLNTVRLFILFFSAMRISEYFKLN